MVKRERGRPRVHTDDADRKRKDRKLKKAEGYKAVNIYISEEDKILLDKFCSERNMTQEEALSFLIRDATDG